MWFDLWRRRRPTKGDFVQILLAAPAPNPEDNVPSTIGGWALIVVMVLIVVAARAGWTRWRNRRNRAR